MNGMGGWERPGHAATPWLRMACVAPLSCVALLSCAEVDPAAAWRGPGSVSMDGTALVAVPYAPDAFERWDGAPCDGAADPVCEIPEADGPAVMPTASFRPFVVAGVKSLAFGLGYPEAPGAISGSVPGTPRAPASRRCPDSRGCLRERRRLA